MARATLMLPVVALTAFHSLSSGSIDGGANAPGWRDAVGSLDFIRGDRDAREEPGEVPVLRDERDRRERRDLRGDRDRGGGGTSPEQAEDARDDGGDEDEQRQDAEAQAGEHEFAVDGLEGPVVGLARREHGPARRDAERAHLPDERREIGAVLRAAAGLLARGREHIAEQGSGDRGGDDEQATTPTRIARVIHRPSRSTASTRVIASVIMPMRLKLIPTAVMIAVRQVRRARIGHRATITKTELIASALAKAIEWPNAPSARTKPPLACNSCQVLHAPFGMASDEGVEPGRELEDAQHGGGGRRDGDAGVSHPGRRAPARIVPRRRERAIRGGR